MATALSTALDCRGAVRRLKTKLSTPVAVLSAWHNDQGLRLDAAAWTQIVSQIDGAVGATGVFLDLRNALDVIDKEAVEIKHGLSWMVCAEKRGGDRAAAQP